MELSRNRFTPSMLYDAVEELTRQESPLTCSTPWRGGEIVLFRDSTTFVRVVDGDAEIYITSGGIKTLGKYRIDDTDGKLELRGRPLIDAPQELSAQYSQILARVIDSKRAEAI